MNGKLILVIAALLLVGGLFYFGKTTSNKQPVAAQDTARAIPQLDIKQVIQTEKAKLTPSQAILVEKLENEVKRGDVAAQQLKSYSALADFWKDSARSFMPYAYYITEAAKLDNSEKSLTFAGQLLVNNIRTEPDMNALNWQTDQAIELFEKTLKLNPQSVDGRIGLGSAYIFGKGKTGNTEETMKGIQQLLSVVREDSTNMKAQMVLGIGGAISGQYEKAIERLRKVVKAEPTNTEAIAFLADTYAAMGNNAEAIRWYTMSKKLVKNRHYTEEVDKRIQELQRK